MKLAPLILATLMLAGCGLAHPPAAGDTREVVALLLIAREVHDVFWAIVILAILGAFSK